MNLLTFSLNAWHKEPDMRIEDAYKWLFHATRGGEHAVSDEEGPRRWLDREWPTLTVPHKGEALLIPLRPDGKIVRLQLRPYRTAGGDKEKLLRAFVASARGFKGEAQDFLSVWKTLGDSLKRQTFDSITFAEWLRLDRECSVAEYPAIDHSRHYGKTQTPAYRVLTHTEARLLVASLPKIAR